MLHLDYNWKRFPDVIAKYGRSVHIDVYRPEAIAAVESLEEGLDVRDILKEFGLETYAEYMALLTEAARSFRARRARKVRPPVGG